ncbi:hypothetical protein [Sulfolobus monocaudavirus SMV3]|uniref:hypothetical protein n=1 Tax=Sulfolobus monocaudavirus SMV3 TaxID=1732177 RepID=UPI000706E6C7|nr:hypothetical protein AXI69_gp54 [Sulfolobus monocaudavirus SMV3]ALG96991.1 hypothetical protein [Sulfolobus monocaudavirus SMV3]
MVKAWFDQLDFDVIEDIEYTRDGKPVKPYVSSFHIVTKVRYDGKYKELDVMVFPQKNKILIGYLKDGEFEVVDAKLYDSSVGMVFDDLLDTLTPITKTVQEKIQEEIQELSNNPDNDVLPNITQTLRVYGTIFNENPYGEYVGNVTIKQYVGTSVETEHKVAEESFEVKKSSDGELEAVEYDHGKEIFNPVYQEMLDTLIPSKSEFEDLIGLIKQAIREGKAEYDDKNLI